MTGFLADGRQGRARSYRRQRPQFRTPARLLLLWPLRPPSYCRSRDCCRKAATVLVFPPFPELPLELGAPFGHRCRGAGAPDSGNTALLVLHRIHPSAGPEPRQRFSDLPNLSNVFLCAVTAGLLHQARGAPVPLHVLARARGSLPRHRPAGLHQESEGLHPSGRRPCGGPLQVTARPRKHRGRAGGTARPPGGAANGSEGLLRSSGSSPVTFDSL